MLLSLDIRNVVLIDRLNLEFSPGFCALTGETGAGKSILLDALGLALGARSESGLVRKGESEAVVTAIFDLKPGHPSFKILQAADIAIEKGEPLIFRRVVNVDGRSRAFVNDRPVSIGLLRELGDVLVEIHGQFDTQGLLDPKTHRALLDEYAGIDALRIAALWRDWNDAQNELAGAKEKMDRARAEETYLRQALEDLDALEPKAGEEEKLASLRAKLMRRDQVMEHLNNSYAALADAESAIGSASRMLERAGSDTAPLLDGLGRTLAELREVTAGIQAQSADLEDNEYDLPAIDDRLFALRAQARKHACAVDFLPEKRNELAAQLNMIEGQEDTLASLMKQVQTRRALYIRDAEKAHDARIKAAKKLDTLVARELPPLKLEKAKFATSVEKLDEAQWNSSGFDNIRFLVATNPGSDPGPLNKIASGGEMARFMLALKVVLAEIGAAQSLVFDEVDSGIGGATASAVGERLARLAKSRQILVVTHSPQVAARAQNHWIVMKDGKKQLTTKVVPLAETSARREEIARMLSGAEITTEARAAADKLLETAT